MSTPMILERCQHGEINESSVTHGEAGVGVYAFVPNSGMRTYYTSQGETCWRLELKDGFVADLSRGALLVDLVSFARGQVLENANRIPGYVAPRITTTNIQRYGRLVEMYVRSQLPDAKAYLVPHCGPGIPTGVQAVIRDLSAFEITLHEYRKRANSAPRRPGP